MSGGDILPVYRSAWEAQQDRIAEHQQHIASLEIENEMLRENLKRCQEVRISIAKVLSDLLRSSNSDGMTDPGNADER
jgi:hypothetical protein